MAIVVEEKQGGTGFVSVFIWLVILGIIAAGAYYLFFKKAELITVTPPSNFRDAQNVSKVKLDIEPVVSKLNPPNFDSHITIIPATTTGRMNPFLGF